MQVFPCDPPTVKISLSAWSVTVDDMTQEDFLGEMRNTKHRAILWPADREQRRGWNSSGGKEALFLLSPVPQASDFSAVCIDISHPSSLSEMCLESATQAFSIFDAAIPFSIFLENTTSGERSRYLPLISPLKTGRRKRTPLIVSDKH